MNKMTDYDIKQIQTKMDSLEESINETRENFHVRVDELSSQLTLLRASIAQESPSTNNISFEKKAPEKAEFLPTISAEVDKNVDTIQSKQININEKISLKEPKEVTKTNTKWSEKDDYIADNPSVLSLFFGKLIYSILGFILTSLSIFFAPIQDLFHKIKTLYFHYQKQGKAPVFLMTIAGLITLTIGFGYLLQYAFNFLFNDTLKTITGFAIGASIVATGVFLAIKKTDFRDYAASVIALGIIFNYLTAYFVGPYYGFISQTTGLLLLLGITLVSFLLAIRFETKIVSVVTLIGGTFMPFILEGNGSVGMTFLIYLFFLASANLYLSQYIKWPVLAQITFILSLSVIEYVGISDISQPYIVMALLSGFFYTYTYFWSFDGLKLKQTLTKQDLTILVSNAFYFIYAILQIPSHENVVASILLLHALVFIFLVKQLAIMQSKLAPIYLLIIGLFIATAVFVLLPTNISSVIWAVEGLAMLYIGFQFKQLVIRFEGYAIYLIAMLALLWQAIESFIDMSYSAIAWHWINLIAFGLLSLLAYRIIYYFKHQAEPLEKTIAFVQNEIFTLWGAITLSIVIIIYTPFAITILAIIPMLWCFYRVSQFQLRFAQISAYFFFLLFIAQLVIATIDSNHPVISQQSTITWVALFESLFFAWGLHFYYQYFKLTGRGEVIAKKLHQLFFYVPITLTAVALLNIYNIHFIEHKALIFGDIWIDFIIIGCLIITSLVLLKQTAKWYKNQQAEHLTYILNETISFFATVFFLYTTLLVLNHWGLNAWVFNAAAIPLLLLMHRGVKNKLALTENLAWSHFLLFLLMTSISYHSVGNLHFSEQTWATRFAWVELLLCAWLVQSIYERLDQKQQGYDYAAWLRIAVYLLLPLLFLPRIIRLYPDYVPIALWASFTISWLMYKKLNISPLLKELTLLFFLAIITSVAISLSALTGGKEIPGLFALVVGLLVLSLFHYVEKTLSLKSIKNTIYSPIHITSPYFYGFILASIGYAVSNHMLIPALLSGWYFIYILQENRLIVILKGSIRLAYLLSWLSLLAIPIMIFIQLPPNNLMTISMNVIALIGLWYLTHTNTSATLIFLKKQYAGQNKQLWIFHASIFLAYTGSLNLIFPPWGVATSLAMLSHAVILLFLTLSHKYQGLLRLSIILYILTAIKVLFHDMNDFANLHKIIALMGIGSILMLAAFIFQKLQNNAKENPSRA